MVNDSLHPGPDRLAALSMYRRRASIYDAELAWFEPMRRIAITRLGLHAGDTVFDVGCGTGLSFAALAEAVGPSGTIVGLEQSPHMLACARERLRGVGHASRTLLLEAPVEAATIPVQADAALFHFTHDILCRPEAIANVLTRLRPGARVVATGLKWAGPWAWPVNLFVLPAALHSVTSLDGLAAPWRQLAQQLGALDVEPMLMGGAYIASGTRGAPRGAVQPA